MIFRTGDIMTELPDGSYAGKIHHVDVLIESLKKNPDLKITPTEEKLLAERAVARLKGEPRPGGIPEYSVVEIFGPSGMSIRKKLS